MTQPKEDINETLREKQKLEILEIKNQAVIDMRKLVDLPKKHRIK